MNRFTINNAPIWAGLLLSCFAGAAVAHADPCAGMPPEQAGRKQVLFSKLYAYDGCDQTLEKCLAFKTPHFSVRRAAADVCRRIRKGESDKAIAQALDNRAESLLPGLTTAKIATDPRMRIGDPSAPVTLTVYACTRCPFCKVLLPQLFVAVTTGSLKGRANVQFWLLMGKSRNCNKHS